MPRYDPTVVTTVLGRTKRRVACDRKCGALLQPKTKAEYDKALRHWRDHAYLRGCAHGN